ncbi:hypothetical protein K440DRAFT_616633 [Wilcoxina mikolae CBS 423.85]|nr:hypothetical protein K440DRAFT_616633 [Wilcoxina mikolae CBS 423.85]
MSDGKVHATEDINTASGFAEQFKSTLFTVYIGTDKSPYYLHRDLLTRRCPYFKSLLAFGGIETSSNSAHLDTAVDTVQAFDMFVEFIYQDTYTAPEYLTNPWKALVHGEVYVLAERLLMPDLKSLALRYMAQTLANAYGTKTSELFDLKKKAWRNETTPVMETSGIVQLLHTVYSYTSKKDSPDDVPDPSKTKEKDSAGKSSGVEETSNEPPMKSRGSSSTGSTAYILPKDPMRHLLARYCASNLTALRDVPEFMQLFRTQVEFAEDLIMEVVQRAERVTKDEIDRLSRKV